MIVKNIAQIGNPIIRKKSKKVLVINSKKIKTVVKNLIDSLYYHDLIGMAAPQIGVNLRIFVIGIRETKFRKNIQAKSKSVSVYINPEISWKSKKMNESYEGCGSVAFANLFGPLERPKEVEIRAYNEKGDLFTQRADGLLARVIQHEYDHLDGIVFVDKVSDTRKLMSRNEYIKHG